MEELKVKPEDLREFISEKEIEEVSNTYENYYTWNSRRNGSIKHFQGKDLESVLTISRELFWNSVTTKSNDLQQLDLDLSIPFVRKEVMDYVGRLASLGIKGRLVGDDLDSIGIKFLQGIYKKWSFKSNEKVENFWELLYGVVNGTVASYVGFNNSKLTRRYLKNYNSVTGDYKIDTEEVTYWNDVTKEVVALEDIYLPKIYERDFQKQGACLRKVQMDEADFHAMFDSLYPNAKYVVPGNRIASDSLYFRLLGGSGTTSLDKIEVLYDYNWYSDSYKIVASGILLNPLGTGNNLDIAPMPFDHKMGPYTWGITSPLDEKMAYGMPMPFLIKDPHKILNTGFTMMIERELRAIDPPVLTSDIESPELIYGQHKVIPVNDVNAYKEFKIQEASGSYFNFLNAMQANLSATAQGGDASAIPSRQPKSAREVAEINQMKQQAMGNATIMYYNILRQRMMLVLKTALQFYSSDKYENGDKRVYRQFIVEDMPLSTGGVGNMEIRIVKDKKPDTELFLEAIKKSATEGKQTEIIEVPAEFIQNLEFMVNDVELEQERSSELELAGFVENVINPMINVYTPMGLADPAKVMLRHLEKMKENISDFASAQVIQSLSGKNLPPNSNAQNGVNQNPQGAFGGNAKSSVTGMKYGSDQNGGLPME